MSSGPNQRLEQLSRQLEGPSSSARDLEKTPGLPLIRQIAGDSASQYVHMRIIFHVLVVITIRKS